MSKRRGKRGRQGEVGPPGPPGPTGNIPTNVLYALDDFQKRLDTLEAKLNPDSVMFVLIDFEKRLEAAEKRISRYQIAGVKQKR